ncbi:hypothetical protein NHQ30_004927 [Ciborinia camelliae]|nr:hypothetical protein NHQ30_004927 [Ciborinia camelliae]
MEGSSLRALSLLAESHLALEPASTTIHHWTWDVGYGTVVGRSSAAQITPGSNSTAALKCTIKQSCSTAHAEQDNHHARHRPHSMKCRVFLSILLVPLSLSIVILHIKFVLQIVI